MRGDIKWFNVQKGYGFIKTDFNDEIFVHFTELLIKGFRKVGNGQRVSFKIIRTKTGYRAVYVKIIK